MPNGFDRLAALLLSLLGEVLAKEAASALGRAR